MMDAIVLGIVAVLVVLAVRLNRKQAREGKGCCAKCGSCPHRCEHKEDETCGH